MTLRGAPLYMSKPGISRFSCLEDGSAMLAFLQIITGSFAICSVSNDDNCRVTDDKSYCKDRRCVVQLGWFYTFRIECLQIVIFGIPIGLNILVQINALVLLVVTIYYV